MKKYLIYFIAFLIILVGCSKNQTVEVPKLINVSIKIPSEIKVNEEVKLQALVTQGEEKVEKAEEVKFEIWKSDQAVHENVEAIDKGNGIYSIKKSFDQAGAYTIIAHVTARSMHSMPKMEFRVEPSK